MGENAFELGRFVGGSTGRENRPLKTETPNPWKIPRSGVVYCKSPISYECEIPTTLFSKSRLFCAEVLESLEKTSPRAWQLHVHASLVQELHFPMLHLAETAGLRE
jgi:hypothetical protein